MDIARVRAPAVAGPPEPHVASGFSRIALAAVLYTVAFFALTWPSATRFRTHWFTDDVDGLQNVWNIWWVGYAVEVLHRSPWHTNYLHYPYGTSLLAHTLNPFNGFAAIFCARLMSPIAVHNTIVTFGFVAGGVTAFLLAHHLTRSVAASLLAGFIFTFSNFHFAHAQGHLQLVSLEWIPLFVLLWLKLVETPTIALGVGAALVLFLVILCDYYYFLYCVLAGAIIFGWWILGTRATDVRLERRLAAFGSFVLVALATSGVLAGLLVWSSLRDPLTGVHAASEYSLDLFAPVIYGGHWRFGDLTRRYWIRLPGNIHETSVHLGLSVIALAAHAWRKRRALDTSSIGVFSAILLFFLVLAFGPTPYVAGKAVLGYWPVLPYAWLEVLFPPLAISGVPIRMMVMVILSVAMLAAFGLIALWRESARERRIAIALAGLLVVEYLPSPIPNLSIGVPKYVEVLRDLPGADGVLDMVSAKSHALFYQTIHRKPLAFGYLARLPDSVELRDRELRAMVQARRYDRLWPDYRLRYVVIGAGDGLTSWPGVQMVAADGDVTVFDVSQIRPVAPLQAEDRLRLPTLQRVARVDDERAARDQGVVVERGVIGADDRTVGPSAQRVGQVNRLQRMATVLKLRDPGIGIAQHRSALGQQLEHVERRRLPHVVDVALIGNAHQMHP
jgi:hypothetical protein